MCVVKSLTDTSDDRLPTSARAIAITPCPRGFASGTACFEGP
jgi:hypothetical protein